MRRQKGHIQEKRFCLVPLTNIGRHLVRQQEGLVTIIVDGHAVALEVLPSLIGKRRVIADLGVQVTVKMIKAPVVRVIGHLGVAEVPFSHHGSLITRRLKRLGKEMLIRVNSVDIPGHDHAIGNTEADRVAARHQRRPGRGTYRCGVKAVEFHAFGRQAIQRRRVDIPAVKTDIIPAQVVCDNDKNVWALIRRCELRPASQQGKGEKKPMSPSCSLS